MNYVGKRRKYTKLFLKALKIALGSSAAIYLAMILGLDYEISAGTITLLTILTTKWETVKLSLFRVITLCFTIAVAWLVFTHIDNEWAAYGIFVFLVVIVCELPGWGATLSVNAVIGAHFLTSLEFDRAFIINESLLVLIGITMAVILNLFHDNRNFKKELVAHMRLVERRLKGVLAELAVYLTDTKGEENVWEDIRDLEARLKQYIRDACEYQDNTFLSHPGYYIDYFQMRAQQCSVLHNLHQEAKKIRNMPVQAKVVADYMRYLSEYIIEVNSPVRQIKRLEDIFAGMKEEPLPETREEFESRAILYHILMDLEDFLVLKKRFVEGLSGRQWEIYWKSAAKEDT